MSNDHSHDGIIFWLVVLALWVIFLTVLIQYGINPRLDSLEAPLTPTPAATKEVPTA